MERAHRPGPAGPIASHIRHQLLLRVKLVNIVYRNARFRHSVGYFSVIVAYAATEAALARIKRTSMPSGISGTGMR